MKRHSNLITAKRAKPISKAMSVVNWSDVLDWRQRFETFLEKHDLIHLLDDPSRIGNADEANFACESKPGLVVSGLGQHSFQVENSATKHNVTLMCCALANGSYIKPFTIFSGTILTSKIKASSARTGLKCICTPKGWMDSDAFLFWIEHVLHPELVLLETEFPFILTVDGFSGHKSEIIAETCLNLQIILVLLPPNTTHVLQPLDNGFFGPIKRCWNKLISKQKEHNPQFELSNNNFLEMLNILYTTSFDKQYAITAFRKTGIFPWDQSQINKKKILGLECAETGETVSAGAFESIPEIMQVPECVLVPMSVNVRIFFLQLTQI